MGWTHQLSRHIHIQDKAKEAASLIAARGAVTDPEYLKMIDWEIMETVLGEEDLSNYLEDPMQYQPPAQTNPNLINEVQQSALGIEQTGVTDLTIQQGTE